METKLILMIVGTAVLVIAAIVLAIYAWRLNKKFPNLVKAKVLRIEELWNGKHRYHFECRNNGRFIASDVVAYKKPKFKNGEKTMVRLGKSGDICHSDYPMWPIISSIACILLAIIVPVFYFSDVRNEKRMEEAEGTLYQETGYYIVTETDTFIYGDNLGLTKLNQNEEHLSTGDYGSVFFLGTPKRDSGSLIPTIQSLGSNVDTDGVPEDVPETAIKQLENMDYVINNEVTDSASLIEAAQAEAELEEEDHTGHNHGDEEVHDDTEDIRGNVETEPAIEIESESDAAIDDNSNESVDTTEDASDEIENADSEIVNAVTEPAE